jgi:hypothetical protein
MSGKINEAVANCLALSESARDPRRLSRLFLARLSEDLSWSQQEVEQVRRKINEALKLRTTTRAAG